MSNSNSGGPASAPTSGPVRTSARQTISGSGTTPVALATGDGAAASSGGPVSSSSAPVTATSSSPRPAAKPKATKPVATGPRRVRLSVSRVDPWSVMKLGFLLSVALGIMTVVSAAVSWNVVDSMGVFADLESLLTDLGAIEQFRVIMEYLRLKNIMSMAVVVAIVNVALITALATLGAFIYNIVAALVGGLHMTLTDD